MAAKRASRQEWARRVTAWRLSGDSAESFASRHGWKATTLRWWASQGRRSGVGDMPFVEVAPPSTARPSGIIDIVLRNGRRLRIREGVELETVAALARALDS